ncbi:bile acid:sodium symporter family protein [Chromobacterium haemolyticum]|uniref:bile acid:sodium symporter family protein n=1 Tax=Chromobacterium haemolyticum TaxID=394935 RepID=UPI000D3278B8|nr:bile acid:sodium symporter family protein [Chromobacterium haemolyticum]PTU70917.1 bile acid:sodium symporter [Chromobacterium haemolyticum]
MPKLLDAFTLSLLATVALASVLPCSGGVAAAFNLVTNLAIALLFFLHGAKLSREAVLAGAAHWRLHLLVLGCTFLLFPALGLALQPALQPLLTPELYLGVLYLCMLPSTVQSSIAFTSMAQGNVPAAICSATASNILGIFITPLLVSLLVVKHHDAGQGWGPVLDIVMQLLLPFVAGQIARRWIGGWVDRNKGLLRYVDQGSILLVVYTAFSAAVISGLWRQTPPRALAALLLVNLILLGLLLGITMLLSRKLGFSRADQITIVFCGSKKSLASGVPMAKVLFAAPTLGSIVLPLMLFHQIQLMACATLAQRYRRQQQTAESR